MKEKWVIGNWKMNLGLKDSLQLAKTLVSGYHDRGWLTRVTHRERLVHTVICPSFPALLEVARNIQLSEIALGGQNMFWKEEGAYTGEVSPSMLVEAGCDYVLVGHSERREQLGETNSMIQKKLRAALTSQLIPIFCIGETQIQKQRGKTQEALEEQLMSVLGGMSLSESQLILVAYEPVWAVGSGLCAEPDDVALKLSLIQHLLRRLFPNQQVEQHFRVLYGGSFTRQQIPAFARLADMDGVLVGRSSLRAEEFLSIVEGLRA